MNTTQILNKNLSVVKLYPILVPYIDSITIENSIDISQKNTLIYKVLPSSCLVMGFQYRGRLSIFKNNTPNLLNPSGITGLQTTYRVFQANNDTRSILVKFKPWGAAAFFDEPIAIFSDCSLSLSDILQERWISNIEEALYLSEDDCLQLGRIIQDFLIQLLLKKRGKQPRKNLIAAINQIYQEYGTKSVGKIAKEYGFTERSLERLFKEMVGLSPKKFSMLVRFETAIKFLESASTTEKKLETLNYFDQSHFIHDFKKLSGVTPREFKK